jgi:hypothetical protein
MRCMVRPGPLLSPPLLPQCTYPIGDTDRVSVVERFREACRQMTILHMVSPPSSPSLPSHVLALTRGQHTHQQAVQSSLGLAPSDAAGGMQARGSGSEFEGEEQEDGPPSPQAFRSIRRISNFRPDTASYKVSSGCQFCASQKAPTPHHTAMPHLQVLYDDGEWKWVAQGKLTAAEVAKKYWCARSPIEVKLYIIQMSYWYQ